MAFTLYANPDNYRTKKILICAKFNGLDVGVVEPTEAKAEKAAPFGRHPVLETPQGCIFSGNAIVRFLGRVRRDLGLTGRNFFESGGVDSWMEFCSVEMEVPLCAITYPILGYYEAIPAAIARARLDVKTAVEVIEKHLLHNTYVVGHQLTIADISIMCALYDAFRLVKVFDEEWRSQFPNVMRWFDLIANQPAVKAVLGEVNFGAPPKPASGKKEAHATGATEKNGVSQGGAQDAKRESKKEKNENKAKAKAKVKAKAKARQPVKEEKTPEELREQKLKKVVKEGGKRGVEIEGAADMGGLQFFCTSMDEPDGDIELLKESLTAMNAESDPSEEERKGGAGKVGKMLFSAGLERLAVVCDVPADKRKSITAKAWLEVVLKQINGTVISGDDAVAVGEVKADPSKGVYPIKLKDEGINYSIAHLKEKGLFPDKDDDSDDEYVFGDDDFP